MNNTTTCEVWIDITMKTLIDIEGDETVTTAMEKALKLMPSHAIDAFERHGYRIKTIETDVAYPALNMRDIG